MALICACFALGACATEVAPESRIPSGGDDCFWANSIYDWRALNDQTLIVWSPSRRCPYRVDLARRCDGLRFAEDLGFQDRDGRICPYGGDAVIVPGPTADRCSIASVRRLSAEELEQLVPSGDDDAESVAEECAGDAQ
jgi:hypothetical protein